MSAEQRQMAADLWTKPTDFSRRKLHSPSPFITTQSKAVRHRKHEPSVY